MAIVMMTFDKEKFNNPNVKRVDDYPGHDHSPLYMETTYDGLVLDLYERNGYDDSDFYAIVWDVENNKPKHIEYASTRGWSYPNGASIDATPDIVKKYEEWKYEQLQIALQLKKEQEAKDPTVGKRVKSLTTKGKAVGVEGVIFWRGANKFRTYYRNGYNRPDDIHNQVVGIKSDSGEKYFIAADKVEVIQPKIEEE